MPTLPGYVVGQAAEEFLAHGKSWGEVGPNRVIRGILGGIDRGSILAQARADIAGRLKSAQRIYVEPPRRQERKKCGAYCSDLYGSARHGEYRYVRKLRGSRHADGIDWR